MKKFTYQATQKLYALIVGIIFLLILFGQWCSFKLKKGFLIPNIVILGGIILAGAFVYYWRYKKNGKQKAERIRKYDLIVKISLIILFVVQIFIAYNIVFEPGWDAGGIYNSAKIFVNGNRADIVIRYPFSMYPNNLLLLFIESAVISFCNLFANENEVVQLMFFAVLNSMINVAACYLTYKSASLICKKKIAFAAFILAVLNFGLSPWNVIFYSDSLGLVFPILTFYLFMKPNKTEKMEWISKIMAVIAGCIGYNIKPQCLIMLIALFIIQFFSCLKNKKKLLQIVILAGCFILSLITIKTSINLICEKNQIVLDSSQRLGMSHFLMMGNNEEGGGLYVGDDVAYSKSFATPQERKKANIQRTFERMKDMGIAGYLRFLAKKMLTVYNDGTYAWGGEGNFFMVVFPQPDNHIAVFLRNIYYADHKYYDIYVTVMQSIWVFVLGAAAVSGLGKENRQEIIVLMLSIAGLTLFEVLFEARARYLYTYAPVFCILAAIGIEKLNSEIKKKSRL